MSRAVSSMSTDITMYASQRYSGPANPVGSTSQPDRQADSLTSADPRVAHPKLNPFMWSVSYAQQPETAKPRRGSSRRGRKRKGSTAS